MSKFWLRFKPFGSRNCLFTGLRRNAIALVLWLVSIFLIFPNLGNPRAIVFDETYLIPNAQSYINGVFFQDSHPPLGRLFIALGQVIMHPEASSNEFVDVSKIEEDWPSNIDIGGYRLFPVIFGSINPVLVFGIVLILTSSEWLSFFAALVVLFDNALLTQSRFALPDSSLIAFCLASILCFVWLQFKTDNPKWKEWIIWVTFGISASAAFMTKFTGLFVLLTAAFYLYKLWVENSKEKIIKFLITFSSSFLIVFVLIWVIHFSLLKIPPKNFNNPISELHTQIVMGEYNPDPVELFLIETQDAYAYMFDYHKNVPVLDLGNSDEIGSPWYYWLFGGRAIPYRWETGSGKIKIIYLIGNPVTWFVSLLGVIGLSASVVSDLFFQFLSKTQRQRFYPFFLLYWVYMLSVAAIPRVMYLYHYLPPMVLGVIMFSLLLVEAKSISQKTRLGMVVVFACCLLVAFQIYSPFTYYKEIPVERLQQLNILPTWNLRCPGC